MMRLLNYLRGYLRLTVSGAYPQEFLNRLAKLGVTFWRPEFLDAFTVRVCLYPHGLKQAKQAAARSQCTLEGLEAFGFRAVFYGLKKRPVLVLGFLAAIALVWALQGRIWTIQVEGCEAYHPQQILRALEEVDVGFGVKHRGLDAQQLETKMKLRLEDLEWFTINFYGGIAQVVVHEREPKPIIVDESAPCNVVAVQGGIVTGLRVYTGKAVVQAGDVVTPGQLLVSGVADHPRSVQISHAMAEVFARTWRVSTAVAPLERLEITQTTGEFTRWSLVVGKKRINFGRNSGIPTGLYGKITTTRQLTLPGGITLPVTLVQETVTAYQAKSVPNDQAVMLSRLEKLIQAWLLEDMNAGTVASTQLQTSQSGAWLTCKALSACEEQIGRQQDIDVLWIASDTNDGN